MKKTFKLRDLDCASCAAKIENSIAALDGVTEIRINFMSQKMVLDAADDKFAAILQEAKRIAKKIEPDMVIMA